MQSFASPYINGFNNYAGSIGTPERYSLANRYAYRMENSEDIGTELPKAAEIKKKETEPLVFRRNDSSNFYSRKRKTFYHILYSSVHINESKV